MPSLTACSIVPASDSRRFRVDWAAAGRPQQAQHGRAEIHAQDIGWITVDRANVRKVILEEAPNLTTSDERVRQARAMLLAA